MDGDGNVVLEWEEMPLCGHIDVFIHCYGQQYPLPLSCHRLFPCYSANNIITMFSLTTKIQSCKLINALQFIKTSSRKQLRLQWTT